MDHDFQLKQLNLNIEKIEKIVDDLMDDLESKRKKIDYLKLININSNNLGSKKNKNYRIFISYYLGSTRLIDNI